LDLSIIAELESMGCKKAGPNNDPALLLILGELKIEFS
jgi:hypothetical protein